ncbi:MAG TPA: lytic transglycosylase domain-containing protein [Bryobacteraceae bacterium]|nr:lytic transglycosylase domain-containing protein [Bryobacteraceae bacterium]
MFVAVAALAACGASVEAATLVKQTAVPPRIRSVVRADSRGRLVRTVVVTPRLVQPRVVDAGDVAAPAIPANAEIPALVEAAARKYDVDPLLVHSVIQVESNYNPYAVSPKGAQGLMQLMPGTARRFGVSNSFDPAENIEGGVRYLKYLSSLFPQDPRLAIAAYNAGEGAVWKYNYQIPPYRETEHYVYKVAERYGKARRKAEEVKTAAVPARPEPEASAEPAAPSYAAVESYIDADGRLHLRTASGSQ